MSSIYEEIIKRLDTLATDIAALTINEGAGAAGGSLSGSGTTNRIAQWVGASTLGDSTLIKTGAGVLTLSAGADYTLTVPATGTAVIGNGVANRLAIWTSANTISYTSSDAHGDILMGDGIIPADPMLTEDQTDWLYADN